jgi:heme/copper-type cytochrome/quinol oxidase subunit 2
MNEPSISVIMEWVLVLITPLAALVTLTAFIVLHRERATATPQKKRRNTINATAWGILTVTMLGALAYLALNS